MTAREKKKKGPEEPKNNKGTKRGNTRLFERPMFHSSSVRRRPQSSVKVEEREGPCDQ